ncbi:hypothetical protein Landi51_12276 [Colletotrichum acutatum]
MVDTGHPPQRHISSSPTVQNHRLAANARHIQPEFSELTPFDLSRTTTPRFQHREPPTENMVQPVVTCGLAAFLQLCGFALLSPHPPGHPPPPFLWRAKS